MTVSSDTASGWAAGRATSHPQVRYVPQRWFVASTTLFGYSVFFNITFSCDNI